jgi:hypothetical protein
MDIRGNFISIERGQVGWSQETIAVRWKWSRGKLKRFLNYLEKEGTIAQQGTRIKGLITILKYDEYQPNGTTDSTTDGHQTVQQTDDRQYRNNKNNKNKNDNNTIAGNPAGESIPILYDSKVSRSKWLTDSSKVGNEFLKVLVWFFDRKKLWGTFENKEQEQLAFKRSLRPAREIAKGRYDISRLEKIYKNDISSKKELSREWQLETIIKYLTK